MTEWVPIRIPETLYKEIHEITTRTKLWVNEHEFIRDAIREKLTQSKLSSEAEAVGELKEASRDG